MKNVELSVQLTRLLMESYEKGVEDTKAAALEAIEKAVAAAIEAEREACAKVCEEQRSIEWVKASMPALIRCEPANLMAAKCAAVIRARGQV